MEDFEDFKRLMKIVKENTNPDGWKMYFTFYVKQDALTAAYLLYQKLKKHNLFDEEKYKERMQEIIMSLSDISVYNYFCKDDDLLDF